jgi:chromosome segregation ATPase
MPDRVIPPDCPVRSGEISELRQHVRGVVERVDELRTQIGDLVRELQKLTRLEIDHSYTRAEVTQLTAAIEGLRTDIKGIDTRLETRIAAIERDMPGLIDLRRRVVGGLWSLAGIIIVAVLSYTLLRGRVE